MIFATVGTQLPFPRLIQALDTIAERHAIEIIAQSAHILSDAPYLKQYGSLPPDEFDGLAARSDMIVAHAGTGSVLSAAQHGKPIILFPRIAALGEHRNEHQLATAQMFRSRRGIYVATDVDELESLILRDDLVPFVRDQDSETAPLIHAVSDFIKAS